MTPRPSHRRRALRRQTWIGMLALFGLLFQQWAMASYFCPIEQSGLVISTMQAVLAEAPCHDDEGVALAIQDDLARCIAHCHPTAASADHTPSSTVPPLVSLPPAWIDTTVRLRRPALWPPDPSVDPHAGAPPRSVRFCSFQI